MLLDIFENYIVKDNDEGIQCDIDGNPMPSATNEDGEEPAYYSLTQDSDYIFASFLQDYNIYLIEVRESSTGTSLELYLRACETTQLLNLS